MAEESVLFRVTRPNTSIFHPDRGVSLLPVQTGEEIALPRSTAEYHVRNGVGVLVVSGEPGEVPEVSEAPETPEAPEAPEEPKAPARRPGRPAKSAE
jgi:hypothetical protein